MEERREGGEGGNTVDSGGEEGRRGGGNTVDSGGEEGRRGGGNTVDSGGEEGREENTVDRGGGERGEWCVIFAVSYACLHCKPDSM